MFRAVVVMLLGTSVPSTVALHSTAPARCMQPRQHDLSTMGFGGSPIECGRHHHHHHHHLPQQGRQRRRLVVTAAFSEKKKKDFLAKPEFDALALQSFRRETILQYNSRNQSEPLRIGIYLFATFVLIAAAPFAVSVVSSEGVF